MGVAWTKNRVVNFTEKFALPYVEVLVGLDGRTYDQAFFHKLLADAKVVNDVDQTGGEDAVRDRRAKRWDSYLGKIREFGLGFAVEEKRPGGPSTTIWRASPVARDFAAGRLSYRQLMALQLMRLQLPKPSMPLQGNARIELQRGARVRPLGLIIQALDWLEVNGASVHLSWGEIFGQLTKLEKHDDLDQAMRQIVTARSKPPSKADVTNPAGEADDTYGDIWLNEFEATGFVRQLKPNDKSGLPAHIVVRSLPRWQEARDLEQAIPFQTYTDNPTSINEYFDFFSASPTSAEWEVINMDERVVEIVIGTEATFDEKAHYLEGSTDIVGALPAGALVILAGDTPASSHGTVYQVVGEATITTGGKSRVHLKPQMLRTDGAAIVTD